jgi:hypothetical protein
MSNEIGYWGRVLLAVEFHNLAIMDQTPQRNGLWSFALGQWFRPALGVERPMDPSPAMVHASEIVSSRHEVPVALAAFGVPGDTTSEIDAAILRLAAQGINPPLD